MAEGKRPAIWRIYFIPNCSYTRPRAKDKLVVIACRDDCCRGFLINSEIDVWIQINPRKVATQALILKAEHPGCLDHDSFVDCIDLYRFEDYELTHTREEISANAKQTILEAVRASDTISRGSKKLIFKQA